ncbi:MAG: NosD domain-containing protein [Thermodesulfobacteriota bacterium]
MSFANPLRAALAVALLLGAVAPAAAKLCGGATPCACGDRVVEAAVLQSDLGPCPGSGLIVAAPVVLDCAGHTIAGNDTSNAKFGIHLDRVTGAEVRSCRVTAFRRGLRINGGSRNRLSGNESFANKYGIDLAGGTSANELAQNLVRDNRDEGVHLGGSSGNRIVGNELRYNKRENLYLLSSHDNYVADNVSHHSKQSAIYVKHSKRNVFVRNVVRDTALQLRGDSTQNFFIDTYLKGNGYVLQAYQDANGWTHPHDNVMLRDCIRKTDFCYRFTGAHDNDAYAARTDGRCDPPVTLAAQGGQEAVGNDVELLAQGCNDDPF